MPDQGTVESVAGKFQAWAETLTEEEQRTLAEWWSNIRRDEVEAHADRWWQQDAAWSNAWRDSWSWW